MLSVCGCVRSSCRILYSSPSRPVIKKCYSNNNSRRETKKNKRHKTKANTCFFLLSAHLPQDPYFPTCIQCEVSTWASDWRHGGWRKEKWSWESFCSLCKREDWIGLDGRKLGSHRQIEIGRNINWTTNMQTRVQLHKLRGQIRLEVRIHKFNKKIVLNPFLMLTYRPLKLVPKPNDVIIRGEQQPHP